MARGELALLALQVLDAQQTYFKSRSKDDLIASKQLEAKLRKAAMDIAKGVDNG